LARRARATVSPSAIAPATDVGPSVPSVAKPATHTFESPGTSNGRCQGELLCPPALTLASNRHCGFAPGDHTAWTRHRPTMQPQSPGPSRRTAWRVSRASPVRVVDRTSVRSRFLFATFATASTAARLSPIIRLFNTAEECRAGLGSFRQGFLDARFQTTTNRSRNLSGNVVLFQDPPGIKKCGGIRGGGARPDRAKIISNHVREDHTRHARGGRCSQLPAFHAGYMFANRVHLLNGCPGPQQ
jgi:hypothetical protein